MAANYFWIALAFLVINYSELKLSAALSEKKFAPPERFRGNNESAFDFLEELQTNYNSIKLSVGTPDFTPPEYLKKVLTKAVWGNYTLHQFNSANGKARLLKALANFYSIVLNRALDPRKNVVVGIGATQTIFSAIQTHTNPGDEWIIIEPHYVIYVPIVRASLGIPRPVFMRPVGKKSGRGASSKDWTFDKRELSGAFNNRTKGIILNNPHNPTGKMLTRDELEFIARLAKKWDTLVICDEVYEFLNYDREFIRMATLPGMFERTITASSASKTFSATGYRVGWAYGGAQIINNLKFMQSINIDSTPTLLQEAIAVTFEKEITDYGKSYSYLSRFNKQSRLRRDYLVEIINELGMTVTVPEAGYFLMANATSLTGARDHKGQALIKWLIEKVGIEGYPLTGYYGEGNKHLGADGVRFCFMKEMKTLVEVERRVRTYKSSNQLF